MAAINNDAFRSILAKTVSLEFMQVWSAGATAPWSEEIVKMLPVVLLIGLAPRVMRSAFAGLLGQLGSLQHLNLASYRAIETGLPIARATPTGVSAMIDPWGRIVDGKRFVRIGHRAGLLHWAVHQSAALRPMPAADDVATF